jgi:hypothetical protein
MSVSDALAPFVLGVGVGGLAVAVFAQWRQWAKDRAALEVSGGLSWQQVAYYDQMVIKRGNAPVQFTSAGMGWLNNDGWRRLLPRRLRPILVMQLDDSDDGETVLTFDGQVWKRRTPLKYFNPAVQENGLPDFAFVMRASNNVVQGPLHDRLRWALARQRRGDEVGPTNMGDRPPGF